jgi:hypothetical protein
VVSVCPLCRVRISPVAVNPFKQPQVADLLITKDMWFVRGVCTGLRIPHIEAGFFSLPCPCCIVSRSRWCESGVNIALVSTSRRITSCWFYGVLRKAPRSPSTVPTATPRVTIGCVCTQLQRLRESARKPFLAETPYRGLQVLRRDGLRQALQCLRPLAGAAP